MRILNIRICISVTTADYTNRARVIESSVSMFICLAECNLIKFDQSRKQWGSDELQREMLSAVTANNSTKLSCICRTALRKRNLLTAVDSYGAFHSDIVIGGLIFRV